MSTSLTDSFLDGHGIPVEPHNIESELARLWGPAAEHASGEQAHGRPSVTRLVLANLVLVRNASDPRPLDEVLDVVVTRFPSRSILLRLTQDPERRLRAEVSAICHLPAPDHPQVCSERIILSAGPSALELLPGAVRPILEPELPFVLWWAVDPRNTGPLFHELA